MEEKNRADVLALVSSQQAEVLRRQAQDAAAFDTDTGVAAMRENYRRERRRWNQGGPAMRQTQTLAFPFGDGAVGARLLVPETAGPKAPLLLYFHGGGMVVGDCDTHSLICRRLAQAAGCVVLAVDYPLSPEAQYPTAVEACAAACRWAQQQAAQWGCDGEKLGFAGDSGGANLALGAYLLLRDEGFPIAAIRALLLYYGTYGLTDSPSMRRYGGPWDGMGPEDLAFYQRVYLGGKAPGDCPYYDCYSHDLTRDMPPCFVAAAQLDPLADDSRLLAAVLQDGGIPCEYHTYAGALHGFLHYSAVMDDAAAALDSGAAFFARWAAGE